MARATAFLMVGPPGVGKTTRARELEQQGQALRLTPDEWMIPLFGESDADGNRDVLEGRLLWTALRVTAGGLDVVVDFGLWGRDERWALRWLFAAVGADCRIEYLTLDVETQLARIQQRFARTPERTFTMTADDLARWRAGFQEPTPDELQGGRTRPEDNLCGGRVQFRRNRTIKDPKYIDVVYVISSVPACPASGSLAVSELLTARRNRWSRRNSVCIRTPRRADRCFDCHHR